MVFGKIWAKKTGVCIVLEYYKHSIRSIRSNLFASMMKVVPGYCPANWFAVCHLSFSL